MLGVGSRVRLTLLTRIKYDGGVVSIKATDILDFSVEERIQMVEDIWDSIAALPEAVPPSEEQKRELDSRLEAYHRNPDAGSP